MLMNTYSSFFSHWWQIHANEIPTGIQCAQRLGTTLEWMLCLTITGGPERAIPWGARCRCDCHCHTHTVNSRWQLQASGPWETGSPLSPWFSTAFMFLLSSTFFFFPPSPWNWSCFNGQWQSSHSLLWSSLQLQSKHRTQHKNFKMCVCFSFKI